VGRAVEAGMIGAFLAFGVSAHLAVLAVHAYRAISYWPPMIPRGNRLLAPAPAIQTITEPLRCSAPDLAKSPRTGDDGSPHRRLN
jgi:hypothetical protein